MVDQFYQIPGSIQTKHPRLQRQKTQEYGDKPLPDTVTVTYGLISECFNYLLGYGNDMLKQMRFGLGLFAR